MLPDCDGRVSRGSDVERGTIDALGPHRAPRWAASPCRETAILRRLRTPRVASHRVDHGQSCPIETGPGGREAHRRGCAPQCTAAPHGGRRYCCSHRHTVASVCRSGCRVDDVRHAAEGPRCADAWRRETASRNFGCSWSETSGAGSPCMEREGDPQGQIAETTLRGEFGGEEPARARRRRPLEYHLARLSVCICGSTYKSHIQEKGLSVSRAKNQDTSQAYHGS